MIFFKHRLWVRGRSNEHQQSSIFSQSEDENMYLSKPLFPKKLGFNDYILISTYKSVKIYINIFKKPDKNAYIRLYTVQKHL